MSRDTEMLGEEDFGSPETKSSMYFKRSFVKFGA